MTDEVDYARRLAICELLAKVLKYRDSDASQSSGR